MSFDGMNKLRTVVDHKFVNILKSPTVFMTVHSQY